MEWGILSSKKINELPIKKDKISLKVINEFFKKERRQKKETERRKRRKLKKVKNKKKKKDKYFKEF